VTDPRFDKRFHPTPRVDADVLSENVPPNTDQEAALAEPVELPLDRKREILAREAAIGQDHYAVLGLKPGATKQQVSAAYHEASRVFHPDRYFGKQLGSYQGRLERVFRRLAEAHATLVDDAKRDAYLKAFACDPVSAFGGVLAFNRAIDAATAEEVAKLFVECVVAPGFEPAALEKFAAKKNLRLLEMPHEAAARGLQLKPILGGMLVQEEDAHELTQAEMKVATSRAPTDAEIRALLFAWKVAKHVKSNAILFAREGQTVGVGAGQMSRVDSVKIAVIKAATAKLSLEGSVVASDAFFPFADGVEEAGKAGATAVIQPGGSVRDQDVIDAANKLGMAMVFTGVRHFRH